MARVGLSSKQLVCAPSHLHHSDLDVVVGRHAATRRQHRRDVERVVHLVAVAHLNLSVRGREPPRCGRRRHLPHHRRRRRGRLGGLEEGVRGHRAARRASRGLRARADRGQLGDGVVDDHREATLAAHPGAVERLWVPVHGRDARVDGRAHGDPRRLGDEAAARRLLGGGLEGAAGPVKRRGAALLRRRLLGRPLLARAAAAEEERDDADHDKEARRRDHLEDEDGRDRLALPGGGALLLRGRRGAALRRVDHLRRDEERRHVERARKGRHDGGDVLGRDWPAGDVQLEEDLLLARRAAEHQLARVGEVVLRVGGEPLGALWALVGSHVVGRVGQLDGAQGGEQARLVELPDVEGLVAVQRAAKADVRELHRVVGRGRAAREDAHHLALARHAGVTRAHLRVHRRLDVAQLDARRKVDGVGQ
mmetsp:Transcript_16111/g.51441  ORF Transcript_16111/g.51441 Transcript_16111/m.51441 type:complete len:422 (+) Transcript_16111:367-1632(+)